MSERPSDLGARDFSIERRYGSVLLGAVGIILYGFVLASCIATFSVWREGLVAWGLALGVLSAVLLFAGVMFTHTYFVRGVRGYVLYVRDGHLMLEEIGGHVLHDAPIAEIRRIDYDHGNAMQTRVHTEHKRWRINKIEIHEEEFDALEPVLRAINPELDIQRV